jgi:hypothetical protein
MPNGPTLVDSIPAQKLADITQAVEQLDTLLQHLMSIQQKCILGETETALTWPRTARRADALMQRLLTHFELPDEIISVIPEGPSRFAHQVKDFVDEKTQKRLSRDEVKRQILERLSSRDKRVAEYFGNMRREIAQAAKQRDGRVSRNSFRLDGFVFDNLTPIETDFLDVLWDDGKMPTLSPPEVMKTVYGLQTRRTQESLKTHKTNLSNKLFRQSKGLWSISAAGGYHLVKAQG